MQDVWKFLAFAGAVKSWNFLDFHVPPGSTFVTARRQRSGYFTAGLWWWPLGLGSYAVL